MKGQGVRQLDLWSKETNKKSGGSTSYKDAHALIDMAKAYVARVRDKDAEPDDLPLIAYYGTGRLASEKHEKLAFAKKGSRLDGYYIALDKISSFMQNRLTTSIYLGGVNA